MYGRTIRQELLLEGRRLLTRHYYGDGRWGWTPRSAREQRTWGDWRVAKMRPKQLTWAKGTSLRARKVHAIRYSLTATHMPTGETVHLTVWQCGGQAATAPRVQRNPQMVCAECLARLAGVHETALRALM